MILKREVSFKNITAIIWIFFMGLCHLCEQSQYLCELKNQNVACVHSLNISFFFIIIVIHGD